MAELTVEPEPYDGEAGRRLIEALAAELDERYGPEEDGGEGWRGEVTPAHVRPPDGVFLVARLDGEPVGCGALKRLAADVGEVKRMYTSPSGRRRGVARAVLRALEAEADRLGYRTLRLETGTAQPESMALYAAEGWHRIAPYGRYRDSPDSACFEKRLSP